MEREIENTLPYLEFITLMNIESPTKIEGCLGEIYISEFAVAAREINREWSLFIGKLEDIQDNHETIKAIELLDSLEDTTHNIECGEACISLIPNENGVDLTIIAGKSEENPMWIHTDDETVKLLTNLKNFHQQ